MADDERTRVPLFKSPLRQDYESLAQDESQEGHFPARRNETWLLPTERRQVNSNNKAASTELFYDLFFVANLTVFTYVHEINDLATLSQHVGFFCILWFTWYNVGLYDVRFCVDSVFERIAKAIQFVVMIGFASTGPKFNPETKGMGDPDAEAPILEFFRGMTLTLMVSRLVLFFQYALLTFYTRRFKHSILPMALIAGTYFSSAMIYLGLYWSFFRLNSEGGNTSFIAWYVVAVAETILVTAVSMTWKQLSFKDTHLVERMTLLTLIILGEGAIAVAKAVQDITFSDGLFSFRGPVAGIILCATLNLYFIYLIYFDWIRDEHFGTIRQQIWAFLHFPLHVAVLLAVEGASQTIVWCAGVLRAGDLIDQFEKLGKVFNNDTNPTASDFLEVAQKLNETAEELITQQLEVSSSLESTVEGYSNLVISEYDASTAIANGTQDYEAANNAFWWLLGTLFDTVFKTAGFEPPEVEHSPFEPITYVSEPFNFSKPVDFKAQAEEDMGRAYQVYVTTFGYFMLSTGIMLILFALLASLSTRDKSIYHYIRIGASAAIGTGICLLTTLLTNQSDLYYYVISPWVLPTVTLSLFIIVVFNSITPKVHVLSRLNSEDEKLPVRTQRIDSS